MKFIIGQKVKMTQVFDSTGKTTPATLVASAPLSVRQIKTASRDGYEAVQLGGQVGRKRETRREYRLNDGEAMPEIKPGDAVSVAVFAPGDTVRVSGVSKGKGFQGVVKRHGFGGGRRTHGQKHSEREPGSIGGGGRAGGRVAKGMRMAGRMGGDRITVKNLKIVAVDADNNQLLVSGAIPGRRGTLIEIYGS